MITFAGAKTSNLKQLWWMFHSCSSLEQLDVSGLNTSKVTSMNSMFYNCSSLKRLNISHFDMTSVEDGRGMFDGVDESIIVIPDGYVISDETLIEKSE